MQVPKKMFDLESLNWNALGVSAIVSAHWILDIVIKDGSTYGFTQSQQVDQPVWASSVSPEYKYFIGMGFGAPK